VTGAGFPPSRLFTAQLWSHKSVPPFPGDAALFPHAQQQELGTQQKGARSSALKAPTAFSTPETSLGVPSSNPDLSLGLQLQLKELSPEATGTGLLARSRGPGRARKAAGKMTGSLLQLLFHISDSKSAL